MMMKMGKEKRLNYDTLWQLHPYWKGIEFQQLGEETPCVKHLG